MYKFAKTFDIWKYQILIKMNYEDNQIEYEASFYDEEDEKINIIWYNEKCKDEDEMEKEFNEISEEAAEYYYKKCLFFA